MSIRGSILVKRNNPSNCNAFVIIRKRTFTTRETTQIYNCELSISVKQHFSISTSWQDFTELEFPIKISVIESCWLYKEAVGLRTCSHLFQKNVRPPSWLGKVLCIDVSNDHKHVPIVEFTSVLFARLWHPPKRLILSFALVMRNYYNGSVYPSGASDQVYDALCRFFEISVDYYMYHWGFLNHTSIVKKKKLIIVNRFYW